MKYEWLNRLNDILIYHIYNGFKNLYSEMQKRSKILKKTNGRGKTLLFFQIGLERIPKLSQYTIDQDFIVFKERLNSLKLTEELFHNILTKTFEEYSEISKLSNRKNIKLEIPNDKNFIHMVYINSARIFWIKPLLFYDNLNSVTIKQNQIIIDLPIIGREEYLEYHRNQIFIHD